MKKKIVDGFHFIFNEIETLGADCNIVELIEVKWMRDGGNVSPRESDDVT